VSRHYTKLLRDEIHFTSNVPSNGLSCEWAVRQVEKTLRESGLSYIDLMLIHALYGGSAINKDARKALVEAQEAGRVWGIGVSDRGVRHLNKLETHIKELEEERGGKAEVESLALRNGKFIHGVHEATL
jgi:diketogulonate reductase-like aldo/keto reductase